VTPGVPTLAAATRRILRLMSRDDKPVVIEGTGLRVPATVFDRPVSGDGPSPGGPLKAPEN
jgi:hypothetical protein